jgi:acetyltransferase-like isoleucine patch superfamily enzyme
MMEKLVIPTELNRIINLPDDITVQGLVYITKSNQKKKNYILTIGKKTLLRSGTVIYTGSKLGNGLQTGHNAVIRENNEVGDNVVIGVNSYLGPNNRIGNNVLIHTGVFLEGVTIGNNVAISPNVVFANDSYPRCKKCVKEIGGAWIEDNVVIGIGSTIMPGIHIGKNSFIGAGSLIVKDVPSDMLVMGNPAKVIKKRSEIKHLHEPH